MIKPFYSSDELVCCVTSVDTRTVGLENPLFIRTAIPIKAAPGKTKEDILAEVQEIEDNMERGIIYGPISKILKTTLTETEDHVAALTYNGFGNIASEFVGELRRERFVALAEYLVNRSKA